MPVLTTGASARRVRTRAAIAAERPRALPSAAYQADAARVGVDVLLRAIHAELDAAEPRPAAARPPNGATP